MKRSAGICCAVWMSMAGGLSALEVATAGEGALAAQQPLLKVMSTERVKRAAWIRSADAYALQVVLDWTKYEGKPRVAAAATPEQLLALPAVPVPAPPAVPAGTSLERTSFFIGDAIANLRGLDPVFPCGRVLTLIDGRRPAVNGQLVPPAPPPTPGKDQPYPPRMKEGRIEVWLLKADGTQLLPEGYSCMSAPPTARARHSEGEVLYKFSVADGGQAVAAAIRIDDDFYIEKLESLQAP
jgi:hypothetical protein